VIATAGRDGRARLWEAKGKALGELGPADDAVLKVGFAPNARSVLAGDWSGEVRVWPVAGGSAVKLALPAEAKPTPVAAVPVPTPVAVPISAPAIPVRSPPVRAATQSDLARKLAALKAVEDAAEKLKEEAARNPKNPALARAYLQLCEAALAMKAEVLEAEVSAGKQPPGGDK